MARLQVVFTLALEGLHDPTMSESATETTTEIRTEIPTVPGTRVVNVKHLPESVWMRIKTNAMQSGLSLKDYLIRLMSESQPFPYQPRKPRQARLNVNTPDVPQPS